MGAGLDILTENSMDWGELDTGCYEQPLCYCTMIKTDRRISCGIPWMHQHKPMELAWCYLCTSLPLNGCAKVWSIMESSGKNVKHSGYSRPKSSLQTAVQSHHILEKLSLCGSNNFCHRPHCSPKLEKCHIDRKYTLSHLLLYLREVSLRSNTHLRHSKH